MVKKLVVLLILMLALVGVIFLTACSSVEVESISIDPSSDYKTEYYIGDEIDLNGIKIIIKRNDGIESSVALTDIRQDIVVMNFKSEKIKESISVIVEYKGKQTFFEVSVNDVISSSIKYTVSFDTGEANQSVSQQEVSSYGTAVLPAIPVRPGYVFDGWFKERTYNNRWNFSVDKVVSDTVLYAKWAKLFTITFIPTEGNNLTPITRYVKSGDTLSSVPSVPEIEGKTGSWDREVFTNIQSNIITYSTYVVRTFNVVFCYMDSDGVTLQTLRVFKSVPYGTNMSTSPDYSGEVNSINPPTFINNTRFSNNWNASYNNIVSNLTVQAIYVSKQYDIIFNLNYPTENEVHEAYEDVIHGNVIYSPLTMPVRSGYAFDGWFKDSGCTVGWNFDLMTVDRDMILYAKWVKEYQVYFLISPQDSADFPNIIETKIYNEGGENVTYKVYSRYPVREETSISKPESPRRIGYTSRWDIENAAFNPVKSNLKVVAIFTIENYSVDFCAEDGTVLETQVIDYGEPAAEPSVSPLKYGYIFAGWREDYSIIIGNLKVYPTYQAKQVEVRVFPRGSYLNPENGLNYYVVMAMFDGKVSLTEPVPTYVGHQFEGWYTDEIFASRWDLSNSLVSQETQIIFYANWLSVFTVRFENEFGNLVSAGLYNVVDGGKVTSVPMMPEKVGKSAKWFIYENGSFAQEATMSYWNATIVRRNIVVRPKYETLTYRVDFVVDAQLTIPNQVEHGQIRTLPDPAYVANYLALVGKNFIRWEPEMPIGQPITSNLTFNVVFSYKTFEVIWRDANNQTLHSEPAVQYGSNPETIFNGLGISRPEKEGYSFTGWRVVMPVGGNMNPVRTNITLEPTYQIKSYILSISNRYLEDEKLENLNITSTFNDYTVFGTGGNTNDPERTGYAFKEWNTSRYTVERIISAGVPYWLITNTATNCIGIHFYDGGKLILYKDEIYRENPPNELRLGTEGWQSSCGRLYMDENAGWIDVIANNLPLNIKSIALPGNLVHVFGEDSDYVARYQINQYTVSFDVSTESPDVLNAPSDFEAQYGTVPIIPSSPTWPGFVFLGWYTEPEFANRWDAELGRAYLPLSDNYTVYARWEIATADPTPGISFSLNDAGTGYIVSGMTGVDDNLTHLTIPNYYNNKPVIGIAYRAIYSNPALATGLVSIGLPNTFYQIANNAFENCVSLESIEIPALVKDITDNAFNGCSSLASITFKEGTEIKTIGDFAFLGNVSLTKIVIPDGVLSIGNNAFYGCSGLISVEIPSSVISIGEGAFANCEKLAFAMFNSASPINIEKDVFFRPDSSYSFFKVYVTDVTKYAAGSSWANENWQELYELGKVIDINNISVDGLWSFAFDGLKVKLIQYLGDAESVLVPSNLLTYSSIDEYAVSRIAKFSFDARVKEVTFDSSVEFEKDAFICAYLLENITLRVINNTIPITNFDLTYVYNNSGILLDKFSVSSSKSLIDIFGGVIPSKIKEVVVIEKDDYIVANMFMNCTSIEVVRIDTSIQEIRDNAFSGCTSLKEIYIKTNNGQVYYTLNIVGNEAFFGCYSLEEFYISDNLDIELFIKGLPSTINSIGQNAFQGTKWLNSRPYGSVIIGDGILYTYKQHASLSPIVTIPATVKRVMSMAFYGNTQITHFIPLDIENSSLQYIGERAFQNCSSLEAVVVPKGFISFGNYAFESATKLGTLVIFGNTQAPLLGADFVTNTLARKQGDATVRGIEIFVDYELPSIEKAKYNDLAISMGLGINYETEMAISYGPEENMKWIYSNGSEAGNKVIKYFGNAINCIVPEFIDLVITEISNNAFSRSTDQLSLNITASAQSYAFSGLTRLIALSISAPNFASVNLDSNLLYNLMVANTALSTLTTTPTYKIKDVLGLERILPSHIVSVNIQSGQETVESEFLEGCEFVTHINMLSIVDEAIVVTPLETELDAALIAEKNILIQTIKDRAFSGTGWMNAIEQDFVVVLDGVLVDYKGVSNVLSIPLNVTTIGYGVFINNAKIEIIYIPNSVTKIEAYAFADAVNLTKVFLAHISDIPSVEQNSFTVGFGRQIFVKNGKLEVYQSDTTGWLTFAPEVEPDVPLITKESERTFKRDVLGNLLLEVRIKSYLVDTQLGDGSTSLLVWHRDSYITYDIPDDTPSYNKYTLVLSQYPQISVRESSEVTIPEIVEEGSSVYVITDLGNNVFMSSVFSISINLDDTVTSFSFSNLRAIRDLTILKTADIGNRRISGKQLTAFIDATKDNATSLNKINYIGSVKLDSLLGIVLEGNPEDLNLRPESLTSVGIIVGAEHTVDEMLKGWSQISLVTFPTTLLSIGVNSLENTSWYQNYYNPNYGSDLVVSADKILYKYKGTSSNVVIPANVQIINTGAFSTASGNPASWTWTSGLTFTTIRFAVGSKAHTILSHAFHGCNGFNNFNAPDLLRNVDSTAFIGTQFSMDAASGLLILEGTYTQGKTIVKYLGEDRNITQIELSADVRIIAAGAFKDLTLLQTVSWGGTASILSHIGEEAFKGCTSLVTVPLAEFDAKTPNISSVGRDAFLGTQFQGLATRFKREDGKYVIYKHAGSGPFVIYSDIYSITPGAVTNNPPAIELKTGASISKSDMYLLLSLSTVKTFVSDGSIPLKDLIGTEEVLSNIDSLDFNVGVTDISSEYASGWYSVININWPAGLRSVGRDAFTGTGWLELVENDYVTPGGANIAGVLIKYKGVSSDVYIDHRITAISADAFRGNEDIERVEFAGASQIAELPPGAFSGCIKLLEIVGIPSTLKAIGQDSFKNTLWLETQQGLVIINGLLVAYRGAEESVFIPKNVEKIYPYVFVGNNVITSIEFDKYSSLERIEANTFANCFSLATVKLSESINFIDSQAFLNTVWLGNVQVSVNGGFIVYEDSYAKKYKLLSYVGTKTIVAVPSQTTEIGLWTFRNNTKIIRVTIDKALYIPDYAFSGCTSLSTVELSVNSTVGAYSFAETPWLASKVAEFVLATNGYLIKYNGIGGVVTLPSTVKGISGDVFRNNQSITALDLSLTSIVKIPAYCFSGATNLTTITFNSAIKEIEKDAFKDTDWLASQSDYVVINGILIAYKGVATSIEIPSTVSYVPRYVFSNNLTIINLSFDANTVALDDYAFYGCALLSSVTNEGLIGTLGAYTFRETPYFALVSERLNGYAIINGILLGYIGESMELIIPKEALMIASSAFSNSSFSSLSFEIRTTEITIGEKAFAGSSSLSTVTLTDNIKEVRNRAFYNTYWLDNSQSLFVAVNNKLLMYIGKSANIEIPANITSIAYGVFTGNKSISSVKFNTTSQLEFFLPENSFSGCTLLNSVTLPRNTYIGENAFKDTLWLIGRGEFAHYNNKLFAYNGQSTSIILPNNIVGVYNYVFKGKTNLISINFSATQTISIISGQFVGCTSLATVILNNSLQELSPSSFSGTPWLANYSANNNGSKFIIINDTRLLAYISSDTSIVIPASINYIGKNVFAGNTSITSIDFRNVTSMVQIPSNAFNGCTSLSTAQLTGFIEEIGINAFKDTPWYDNLPDNSPYIVANKLLFFKGALTEYTVPQTVLHIGTNAFYGSGITTLYMESPTPCSLGRGEVLAGITSIYVPDQTALTLYQNNSAWIPYRSYIRIP